MTSKTALIIIDVQEDFLPSDGALAVTNGRQIIPEICDLLDIKKYKWSAVIATQDWHPSDHTSFASNHDVKPFTELAFTHPLGEKTGEGKVKTSKQIVWPDHCIQNTLGSSLDPLFMSSFNQLDGKIPKAIVKKGYLKDREYYSCFTDTWGIHKTEMEDTLRKLGITDVVFVGLAYDFCVFHSAVDCLKLGFNSYILKSATKGIYTDKFASTEEALKDAGVKILNNREELIMI